MKDLLLGIKINLIGNVFRFSRAIFFFSSIALYGSEKFGVYTIAWSIVELIMLFGALGIDESILFETAHYRHNQTEKLYQKLSSSFKASFLITSIESLIVLGYTHLYVDTPDIKLALYILVPTVPFFALGNIALNATMGLKEMKYNALLRSVVEPALLLALAFIFRLTPWKDRGIILSQALTVLVVAFLSLVVFQRFFSWKKVLEALPKQKFPLSFLHYSLPMYLLSGFDNILFRADIFLITTFLGSGSPEQQSLIGVYGLAKQIARIASQTKKAIGGILVPVASESFLGKDRESLKSHLRLSLEKILFLNIIIGFTLIFFSKNLVGFLGKNAALISTGTFLWLVIPQLLYSTSSVFLYFLVVTRSAGRLVVATMLTLLAAAVVGGKATLHFGLLGAAGTAGTAYLLVSLVAVVEARRIHRVALFTPESWRTLVSGVFGFCFSLLLQKALSPTLKDQTLLIVSFLPGIAIYLVLALFQKTLKGDEHVAPRNSIS